MEVPTGRNTDFICEIGRAFTEFGSQPLPQLILSPLRDSSCFSEMLTRVRECKNKQRSGTETHGGANVPAPNARQPTMYVFRIHWQK
jgi:hypothetical protein